ncbi:glycoside hydrolase family 95-like protein [Flectobacillus roseus]|uniref:glycoside hydrolase family 95-like protein n=1 Tax=Flectobacillus roseus TaxID=502259 RepID=UPI00363FF0B3
MLLQSSNNNIHLLPALLDGWQTGRVSGLKTRGGFEIISLQWKDGKVSELIIKSNLGGNLRLRLPNKIELANVKLIEKPTGENSNHFFQTEPVKTPIIGINANIKPLALKETFLFDIPTTKGKVYEFSPIL